MANTKKKNKKRSLREENPQIVTFQSFLAQERESLKKENSENLREKLDCFDKAALPFLKLVKQNENDEDVIKLYRNEIQKKDATINTFHTINMDSCPRCGKDFIQAHETTALYCPKCGKTIVYMDSSSTSVAFGEEIEYTSFSYQRINHLKEWINHFECKENTTINESFFPKIMEILRQRGIRCSADITFRDIKKALKELKLQKYYDMCMQIWIKLTGRKPIRLHPIVKEKIHLMFKRIQIPFQRHCPPERKNFLSYPYLLFKFCQLLGENELLPYFSLLKGPHNLQLQEEIFAKICVDLNWIFIPIPNKYIPKY